MGDDAAGQQQQPPPEIVGDGGVREVRLNVIADDKGDGYLSPAGSMSPSLSFRWKKYRLWRVPEQVRAINKEEAYAPKFVSIGPYHRYAGGGDRNRRLRGEKLKKRYLHELLKDVEPDDHKHRGILQRCKSSLQETVDDVRWFYAEEEYVRDMKDEEIVRMVLHDGCFIVKHLFNFAHGTEEEELYATRWSPAQLRIDLSLLENQIPFFVLVEIFYHLTPWKLLRKIKRGVGGDEQTLRQRKRHTLLVMAMWYMLKGWFILPEDESDKLYKLIAEEEVHHLLHLVHIAHLAKVHGAPNWPACDWQLCLQWSWQALQFLLCILPLLLVRLPLHMCRCCGGGGACAGGEQLDPKANIASASQLRGLGVKIRMVNRDRGGILDVRVRNSLVKLMPPELEVPALSVEQATAVLLQNLVAYEQQGTPAPATTSTAGGKEKDYFTTYAFLMYNLVSTTEDIAVLQEQGVLLNNFGSHETIINYFKNLCRWNQRSEEKTPIGKVLDQLRVCSHYQAYRDWAEAKKYMDSPVKILALIVSTLLAISTILQTTTAFYNK